MSEKHKKHREPVPEPARLTRRYVLAGVAVMVAAAALAVVAVTYFGGSSLSKGDPKPTALALLPTAAARPPTPTGDEVPGARSAAADALAKKWDDASDDERALIQTEVNRVFDNSTFRASSAITAGVDIFRRDGHTHVSRQYLPVITEGQDPTVSTDLVYYCPVAATGIDAFRYETKPSQATTIAKASAAFGTQPWERVVASADWSTVKDQGFKTINGRQAHGLEMQFKAGGGGVTVQYWFDVETARLLERSDVGGGNAFNPQQTYTLDYRALEPPRVPQGLQPPPCINEINIELAKAPA